LYDVKQSLKGEKNPHPDRLIDNRKNSFFT
jgi:hypothetical protein